MDFCIKLVFLAVLVNSIVADDDWSECDEEEDIEEVLEEDVAQANFLRKNSAHNDRNHRFFSRTSGTVHSWAWEDDPDEDAGEEVDDDTGPLRYGARYKGIGKIYRPEECARQCVKGKPPKTCYHEFHLEMYHTLGGACTLCTPANDTWLTSTCQCIQADGVDQSGLLVINRMLPGPTINLCIGDRLIVDLHNQAPGTGFTIHWHGIYQKGYQYYDGVAHVTQCPILYRNIFRYTWRAQNSGTHFWHAHSGLHKADGPYGAIIIRSPPEYDPTSHLYDVDDLSHWMLLSDHWHASFVDHWPGTTVRSPTQDPDNILINGRGQWLNSTSGEYTTSPLTTFYVTPNRRYRFRIINGFASSCPSRLTIERHTLSAIALDGDPIHPVVFNTWVSLSAERLDAILHADQESGCYWIQLQAFGACESLEITQLAILCYDNSDVSQPATPRPVWSNPIELGIVHSPFNDICNGTRSDVVCVTDCRSIEEVDSEIYQMPPDVTAVVIFGFYAFPNEELYEVNTYRHFQRPGGGNGFCATVNGISNVFASAPFTSQYEDVKDEICNSDNLPENCEEGRPCFCSHVTHTNLGDVVEFIIVDIANVPVLSHPWHLHGYAFWVLAVGDFRDIPGTNITRNTIMELDRQGYFVRNFNSPPSKDTLAIPSGGYAIVRFVANNPGWWLFHCHFLQHLASGMAQVIQTGGQNDLPDVPEGFPRCGNYRPSVYL